MDRRINMDRINVNFLKKDVDSLNKKQAKALYDALKPFSFYFESLSEFARILKTKSNSKRIRNMLEKSKD